MWTFTALLFIAFGIWVSVLSLRHWPRLICSSLFVACGIWMLFYSSDNWELLVETFVSVVRKVIVGV